MTGFDTTQPIETFYRSFPALTVTYEDVTLERALNVKRLYKIVSEFRPIELNAIQDNRERQRSQSAKEGVPNLTEWELVLVPRKDYFAVEKMFLRWRGLRRIVRLVNDYVYNAEDFHNSLIEEVHATRLKFCFDQ